MNEPIQIIVGANQPGEIWAGIKKDPESIERFDRLMKIFGLSDAEIQIIKWEKE
jgi:hypothetical protein